MPRPKRTKVASTTARVANTPKPVEPAASHRLKSRKVTASIPKDSFSDDSDGLVVKSTRSRQRMPWQPIPEPREDVDFTMTGALPVPSENEDTASASKNNTPLSRAALRKRSKLGVQSSSGKTSPKVMSSRKSRSLLENAIDTPTEEEDSTGFGDHLLSFSSVNSESPAHGTRPPSAIKVGATPAHEASILALKHFKRRPRQPSLLRMVHQTTDIEDNDLDDLDDLGDFDDFHPVAESTPLPKPLSAPFGGNGNDSGVNLSSSSSRGTKRKLSPVVQVPRSSPPYDPPSGPDVEGSPAISSSLPEVIRSTEENQYQDYGKDTAEPDVLSETMAPPMSSSDYAADDIEETLDDLTKSRPRRARRTLAKTHYEDSDEEAVESPTNSKGRQKPRKDQGISTAKLQALLPKRRTRVAYEEEEVDTASPVDSSEDELALPARRQVSSGRKAAAPKTSKKASHSKKKQTTGGKEAKRTTRTYTRRASSDKENERREAGSEEEDDVRASTPKPSVGLEALAKKFEDIDAFELDFESVSYVQTSSSPIQ